MIRMGGFLSSPGNWSSIPFMSNGTRCDDGNARINRRVGRGGVPVLLGAVLLLAGCSGMSATQVGQTAGGMAGGVLIPGVGAPIGALVGTLAGLVIDQSLDRSREQKERVDLSKQLQSPPTAGEASASEHDARPLGPPARIWVDEMYKDGRLTAGHFEFRPIP